MKKNKIDSSYIATIMNLKKIQCISVLSIFVFFNFCLLKQIRIDGKVYDAVGNFENGKLNGEGKVFYDDKKIKEEGIFERNVLIKGKKYFENGEIHKVGNFKDGELEEGRIYDKFGDSIEGKFKNGLMFGPGKTYYKEGALKSEGTFKINGIKSSLDESLPYRLYHRNGQLMHEVTEKDIKNGKFVGIARYYHPNGQLEYEHRIKPDGYLADGIFKKFHDNGRIAEQKTIKNGDAVGAAIEFDEDGEKKEEYSYKNGSKSGPYKKFKNGKLFESGIYDNNGYEVKDSIVRYDNGVYKLNAKRDFKQSSFCKLFQESYSSGKECGLACTREHTGGALTKCLTNCSNCF